MHDFWQAMRSLGGHGYMPAVIRFRGWRRFLINFSIAAAALFLGLMSWLIAKPTATRLHETVSGERMTFAATPDIDISLDAESTITVTNAQPPRIELLRGNAYFDVRGNDAGKLQVKVGTTYIRDIGTRFSVSKRTDGGSVAVASGQVEIQVEAGKYLVGAHERADFNNMNVTGQRVIAEADVAPWRPRR